MDDDDGLRRLTSRALGRRGFVVETAASADEGLARLQSEQFDLVAIDHHMPGKNGRQMLDEIVALDSHPPVVFVTGNDDTSIAVDALHAGALDFVVKTVGDSFFDLLDGRFRQALTRADLESSKRRAEADLRAANELLELQVREVHHRVSNSLQMVTSFVGMQANRSDNPAVRSALEDAQNRIAAISKVHQRLYTREDLTTIDLDAYLENLVIGLQQGLPSPDQVRVTLTSEPIVVATDVAVSVGIIVNELVSNAAKYAFGPEVGGSIEVSLRAVGANGFAVRVADDGVGIVSDSKPVGTGLGSRIMAAVAAGLGSRVETIPQARGSAFEISVSA